MGHSADRRRKTRPGREYGRIFAGIAAMSALETVTAWLDLLQFSDEVYRLPTMIECCFAMLQHHIISRRISVFKTRNLQFRGFFRQFKAENLRLSGGKSRLDNAEMADKRPSVHFPEIKNAL